MNGSRAILPGSMDATRNPYEPPRAPDEEVGAALVVSIVCSTCPGQIRLGDTRCPSCQRPVTSEETDALRRRWEASDPEAARNADSAAYGRYTLVIVAGLTVVEGLAYGVVGQSLSAAVFSGVVTAAMLGLFLWSARRPLPALVMGTSIYVGLQLVAVASPWDLFRGIIIKLFVTIALVGGLLAELRLRRRTRQVAGR
jgi:hypothetical protein